MSDEIINLKNLTKEQVPVDLRAETYFNLNVYPFEHQAIFDETNSVIGALTEIGNYCIEWLNKIVAQKQSKENTNKTELSELIPTHGHFEVILEKGAVFEPARIIGKQKNNEIHVIYVGKDAQVMGADIYLDTGSIYIGEQAILESCAGIRGPVIIGKRSKILHGAYLRENCVLGDDCVVRGELKNVIIMNKGSFPHPSYLGDSLCGYQTHFGNQVTAANLGIYEGMRDPKDFKSIIIKCDGKVYDIGRPKMGICMGDFSQIGCNSVADPGTFFKPYTVVYAHTRIPKGFYGPKEVLKNKPLKHGLIERVPLRSLIINKSFFLS